MYNPGSSRSPPPLQHPRPQHPPSLIPSTSPPPDGEYQRFSSPPVPGHSGGGNSHIFQSTMNNNSNHLQNLPDSYIPSGSGMSYSIPQQQQQQHSSSQQQSSSSSQLRHGQSSQASSSGGGGMGGFSNQFFGGGGGGVGGSEQPWSGMNDATTQMGVQFGKHAFDAGSAYLDKNFTRLLPLAHLKHSFNVDNTYVLNKLRLVLWPWRHRPWSRSLRRSEISGVAEGWRPPREDINCPDLYIPAMAVVTYVLLAAVVAGSRSAFDPSILGQTASKAFGLLFFEFLGIKLGCYLLGIGEEGTVVDFVAYEGYKFVGVIVTLLAGLSGAKGWLFWAIFLYVFLADFFFLLRSLRHLVLPDPSQMPIDPHSEVANASSISHAQRSRRISFLFTIALAQGLSMGILVWI